MRAGNAVVEWNMGGGQVTFSNQYFVGFAQTKKQCKTLKQHLSKTAFTLAEVLITLGIIGIVAAMTIPTLITQNQQKGWDTASKVFEQSFEEALRVMNTQQVLAGYKTTEDFIEELKKHLSITKTCKNDNLQNCFEGSVLWATGDEIPTSQDIAGLKFGFQLGQENWQTNIVGIQVSNGTSGIIAYNPNCTQEPYNNQFSPQNCIALIYDTSGYAEPNTINKDVRSINVTSFNNKRAFKAGSFWYGVPFMPTSISQAECQKTLSAEECSKGSGYWLGAAVKCGGIDKIPNRTQLGELAGYFCDKSAFSTGNHYGKCTPNITKIQQAGLIARPSGTYQIFGDARSTSSANTLFIEPSGTIYNQSVYPMGYNTFQAICIVD